MNKEKLQSMVGQASDRDLKGLSWDELKYLKDRGHLSAEQERKHGFIPNREGGTFPSEKKHESQEVKEEFTEEDLSTDEDLEEESDEDVANYEDWTKAELQNEIDQRNEVRGSEDQLRRTGTVAQLAALLREDDDDEEG